MFVCLMLYVDWEYLILFHSLAMEFYAMYAMYELLLTLVLFFKPSYDLFCIFCNQLATLLTIQCVVKNKIQKSLCKIVSRYLEHYYVSTTLK